jgi:ABC-type multidrug transport system ATPase subunit
LHLAIENVSKRYGGGNWALQNFTLQLGPGVLGLLGPNGAGKTTLMSILATITRATAGRVVWNGEDLAASPDALRSTLGYLPQDFGVYPNLNAVEFLQYLAAVKGLDAAAAKRRIDELLNLVNLTDVRKRPLGGYSGGMKQRVGIAQALLNDPQTGTACQPGLPELSSSPASPWRSVSGVAAAAPSKRSTPSGGTSAPHIKCPASTSWARRRHRALPRPMP